MIEPIDFYFDLVSPYAYLAHTQLPKLAERVGSSVVYHPVNLDTVKRAAGNTGPSSRDMPVKHKYLRTDLRRWADLYGVPLSPPTGYGSMRLNAGALLAIDRGCAQQYLNLAWTRVWGEGGVGAWIPLGPGLPQPRRGLDGSC